MRALLLLFAQALLLLSAEALLLLSAVALLLLSAEALLLLSAGARVVDEVGHDRGLVPLQIVPKTASSHSSAETTKSSSGHLLVVGPQDNKPHPPIHFQLADVRPDALPLGDAFSSSHPPKSQG